MTTPRDDLRERLEAEAIALSVRRFTDLDDTDADALAALLREAAARLGEREWRPIESAPKGRKIIAGYHNALGKWRSIMARYYLPGSLESEYAESGFADEGWYEECENADEVGIFPTEETPTHFMPLPSPPEATNAD